MNMTLLCCILLIAVVVLAAVCLWQRHKIWEKDCTLVHFIGEYLKYKELYHDLKYDGQRKEKENTN